MNDSWIKMIEEELMTPAITPTINNRPLPPRNKMPEGTRSATFEQLLGACEDLWESDEEFEEFLKSVEETRKEVG